MALKKTPGKPLFRYTTGQSRLHKLPAALKLITLPCAAFLCMKLPVTGLAAGILLLAISTRCAGWRFSEQINDIKPAAWYIIFMLSIMLVRIAAAILQTGSLPDITELNIAEYLRITLRLILLIQVSALLFHTTSTIAIKESLAVAEQALRNKLLQHRMFAGRIPAQPRAAVYIALFISFIPEVFETWQQIERAWNARAGKNNGDKIKTLCFAVITLSMEKAARKARALTARGAI